MWWTGISTALILPVRPLSRCRCRTQIIIGRRSSLAAMRCCWPRSSLPGIFSSMVICCLQQAPRFWLSGRMCFTKAAAGGACWGNLFPRPRCSMDFVFGSILPASDTRFIGPGTDKFTDVVQPTTEITYRWKEGTLIIEAPRVLMLAGFVPDHFRFAGGEALDNISVKSPAGSAAFASEGERYVCIGVCTRDGKPLVESRDIVLTAVSTSCNSGFKFDVDKFNAAQKERNHPPLSAAVSIDAGQLPVLVSRVGCTLKADWLKGMTVRRKDFSLNCYREDKIETNWLTISAASRCSSWNLPDPDRSHRAIQSSKKP